MTALELLALRLAAWAAQSVEAYGGMLDTHPSRADGVWLLHMWRAMRRRLLDAPGATFCGGHDPEVTPP